MFFTASYTKHSVGISSALIFAMIAKPPSALVALMCIGTLGPAIHTAEDTFRLLRPPSSLFHFALCISPRVHEIHALLAEWKLARGLGDDSKCAIPIA